MSASSKSDHVRKLNELEIFRLRFELEKGRSPTAQEIATNCHVDLEFINSYLSMRNQIFNDNQDFLE